MFYKPFLLVFALLIFNTTMFSQGDLKERVGTVMCNCLNKLDKTKNVDFPDLKSCLKTAMLDNLELMQEVLKKEYGDSADYQKGMQLGEKLGRHIDTAMVYSCDTYFRLVDSLRFVFTNQFNKDSALKLLAKFNQRKKDLSPKFYLERSRLQFLTGKYKEALNDMEESSKDPQLKNAPLILKGLCLDKLGRFDEAAAVFYQLAYLSKQHNYLVSAAIENRKWQEQRK